METSSCVLMVDGARQLPGASFVMALIPFMRISPESLLTGVPKAKGPTS